MFDDNPTNQQSANVFISYRREDSAGHTGRLFDRIGGHFGERVKIFMDIDSIAPGEDFINVIEKAVGSCQVLVAIIGRDWLTVTDEAGQRRLDIPEDFVRVEIAAALNRNIRVIPVLVQGASMPRQKQLPDVLTSLSRRNAIEVSDARWVYDADRLIQTIEDVLGQQPPNDGYAQGQRTARKAGKLRLEPRLRVLSIVLVLACLTGLGLWQFGLFNRRPGTSGNSNDSLGSNTNTPGHTRPGGNSNDSIGSNANTPGHTRPGGNSNDSNNSNTNTSGNEPPFNPERHRSEIEQAVYEMRKITSADLFWTGLRNDNDFLEFCLKNYSETWLVQEIPDPKLTGKIIRQINIVDRHLNGAESRHKAVVIILLVYRNLSNVEKISLLGQLQLLKSSGSLSPKIRFNVWDKSVIEKALQQ